MADDQKPRTGEVNARLWGARARDWAQIQEGTCMPVYLAVFDRLGLSAGDNYLDVGCGAGMATRMANARGAKTHGLDTASTLLEIARERVPDGEFSLGDLEELPFDNDSFTHVTGFNSFQYAGDPGVALTEARRVTQAGGSVVIMTWGQPEGMEAASLVTALRPLLPPPPPGAPGPFALSDESALRSFALGAGLEPIEILDVDSPWQYPDLATALRGLKSSGVAARAIGNSSEEAVDDAHTGALAPFRQSDGSYRIGACFRCLIARA